MFKNSQANDWVHSGTWTPTQWLDAIRFQLIWKLLGRQENKHRKNEGWSEGEKSGFLWTKWSSVETKAGSDFLRSGLKFFYPPSTKICCQIKLSLEIHLNAAQQPTTNHSRILVPFFSSDLWQVRPGQLIPTNSHFWVLKINAEDMNNAPKTEIPSKQLE